MKTIGLVGGMSWESTAIYYRYLNELARARLGGLHSAQLLMWSFDFAEIEALQTSGDWKTAIVKMIDAARRLERGGAQCIVICTNTMHKMADDVQQAIEIPLIHIADATAIAIKKSSASKVGLLATRYTMEQEFYKGRLVEKHGLQVLVPEESERTVIHDIIYRELCQGVIRPESKQQYLEVIAHLRERGAESVILGCTEIGLLIKSDDLDMPLFDSTLIHAEAAIDFAMGILTAGSRKRD